jgi:hypothetical protein
MREGDVREEGKRRVNLVTRSRSVYDRLRVGRPPLLLLRLLLVMVVTLLLLLRRGRHLN